MADAAGAQIELIESGHRLHSSELDLRFRVLREPLGMPRGSEVFEHEAVCLHWVVVVDDTTVGCVVLHPTEERRGRLLQMAVEPDRQGQGLGRRLVLALEEDLRARGFEEVFLHARRRAIGFYRKLGYENYGESYIEVGIPHQSMQRDIRRPIPSDKGRG